MVQRTETEARGAYNALRPYLRVVYFDRTPKVMWLPKEEYLDDDGVWKLRPVGKPPTFEEYCDLFDMEVVAE